MAEFGYCKVESDTTEEIPTFCGDTDTPPEIIEATNATSYNLLPEKSRSKYETVYQSFMDWRKNQNAHSFSENVLLVYFQQLSQKYKSSSLWAHYSMMKSTLALKNNIQIEHYPKLRAFLKRKSEGYRAKKAKTFTSEEIHKYVNEAPDRDHLVTKVALIMGLVGACRSTELRQMNISDIKDLGSAFLVNVPNTKTKTIRTFTITDKFYVICKKYINIRPKNPFCPTTFFLNYKQGKCTIQTIGINQFGSMGKKIANFLNLPNPELYTGHTLRRSSTTLLVDCGGEITVKKHAGWKSTSIVESCIVDDSIRNKISTPDKIFKTVNVNASTSSFTYVHKNTNNENVNLDINTTPTLNFTNCSNITINFYRENNN